MHVFSASPTLGTQMLGLVHGHFDNFCMMIAITLAKQGLDWMIPNKTVSLLRFVWLLLVMVIDCVLCGARAVSQLFVMYFRTLSALAEGGCNYNVF